MRSIFGNTCLSSKMVSDVHVLCTSAVACATHQRLRLLIVSHICVPPAYSCPMSLSTACGQSTSCCIS
ncbi:hypothetical protein Plhal304r1_c010g0039291 [Plasmopara halstedii]